MDWLSHAAVQTPSPWLTPLTGTLFSETWSPAVASAVMAILCPGFTMAKVAPPSGSSSPSARAGSAAAGNTLSAMTSASAALRKRLQCFIRYPSQDDELPGPVRQK